MHTSVFHGQNHLAHEANEEHPPYQYADAR
jgi:hypothetical protein